MIHLRKDYRDRFIDRDDLIPADEPVFLVSGQDWLLPLMLRSYAQAYESATTDPEQIMAARKLLQFADQVEIYQQHHGIARGVHFSTTVWPSAMVDVPTFEDGVWQMLSPENDGPSSDAASQEASRKGIPPLSSSGASS